MGRITRRELGHLGGIAAAALCSTQGAASDTPQRLFGLNVAGGEFGVIPGVYGRDYVYPDLAAFRRYRALGFNCVRVPFRWERLQPVLGGKLDRRETARLLELVSRASKTDLTLVLDLHNYARRRLPSDNWAVEHVLGSPALATFHLADIWRRLAVELAGARHVIFGLMNEPFGISAADWLAAANEALAAIRATKALQLVLVPGTAYTGAHSWHAAGNTVLSRIEDKADRYLVEVHQYFDADSSGTAKDAVSATIGSERVRAFEAWCRENGLRAFLGEFGASRDETSCSALDNLCAAVQQSDDVWAGWTAWAAGPWWPPEYPFKLEPSPDGLVPPQTSILARYASYK